MWLFDKRAFTSTVAYDPKKDLRDSEHKKVALASDDPQGWLLIRARVQEDLEAVQTSLRKIKDDPEFSIYIDEDKTADYSFRALVSRPDFKAYLAAQVDEIDYDSHFKEVVEKNATQGVARHSAMMTVWTAMARLQPHAPYGGFTGGYYGTDYYYAGTAAKGGVTKPIPAFEPSTQWIRPHEVKAALTESPVSAFAHDFIEAMDDDAFELYLAASKLYGSSETFLTAEQVDDVVDYLNAQDEAKTV